MPISSSVARGQIGTLFNVLVSLVVGLRLLALWLRTRQLPELCIGIAFFLGGFIGSLFILIAQGRGDEADSLGHGVWAAAFACISLGAAAMAFFAWWVFRRESLAGVLVLALLAVGLAGGYLGQLVESGFQEAARRGDVWYWVGFVSRMGVYGWMAFESILYYGRMRKRLRVGLAEPLVANRFLLWGLASASVVVSGTLGALELAAGARAQGLTVPIRMMLFAFTAVAVWFTFFPPSLYRRWFASRASPSA